MKPKFRNLIARSAPFQNGSFIVCAFLCVGAAAYADQAWLGANSASWNNAGNWNSAIPNASDVVNFNAGSTLNLATTLDADFSIAGIAVGAPAGPVSVAGANLLTLGSNGINMSAATQPLTIDSNVDMGGDQTWSNATGLTVNGVVSDGVSSNGYSLTKAGAGTTTLNGLNTYTGSTNVTEGTLSLGNNASIGSPGVVLLSDGTALSVPQSFNGGAGYSLLVDSGSTADYIIRTSGGFMSNVGAFGTDATLNLKLNFNNNTTSMNGDWKANGFLWYLNISTQPGTRSQLRLRPNGGAFDTSSFAFTDVSVDNTRIYVTSNSTGNTILLGSLTGTSTAELSGGEAGSVTYSIGRANGPDTVFNGWFTDNTPTGSGTNVTKNNDAKLTIVGDCTNKGTFNIVDGILQFGTGGATGSPGTGPIIVDSDGFAGGELLFNRTGAYAVAGAVSGTGPITLDGGADATFSGSNSFTGLLTVNGGSIIATTLANGGVNSGIGASTPDAANVILNGASLRYTGGATSTDRNFTIGTAGAGFGASGSGAVTYSSTAPLVLSGSNTARNLSFIGTSTANNTFSPQITNNGSGVTSVTKSGAGTWLLAGANTYSGTTSVSGGRLVLGNLSGSATGTGAISVQSGARLAGTGTATGAATLNTGAAVAPGNLGIGTLTLGGITFASGSTADFELQSGGPNDLLVTSATNGLVINGGGVNLYQPGTTNSLTAPGVYNLIQYSGTIGGSGALTVLNPAIGTNYAIAPSGGYLRVTVTTAALPNTWTLNGSGNWSTPSNWSTGVPGGAGATIRFLSIPSSPSVVTLDGGRTAGGLLFDNVNGYTIATGSGVLTLDNSGNAATVTSITGNHAVNVGVTLSSPGMVVDTAASTSVSFGAAISGAAPLVKNGDGLLVLNGSNIFSGGVTINAGSVRIGTVSSLGSGAVSFMGNGSLVMGAAGLTISNPVSIASTFNGTINTNGNNTTFSNVISGAGGLTKAGAADLFLTNTNTYAGGTTITGGLIEFASVANIGSNSVTFDGGGLRWAAGNTLDPSTLVTNFLPGGGVFDTNGNNINVAGNVGGTGAGRFTKQGAGLMTLAAGQTFQGGVSVLGGTLAINNVTALGAIPAVATPGNLVFSNATLQTTNTLAFNANRGVTLGGAVTMAMTNPADSVTIAGVIDGSGSLSLQGGGIWTFNGANSYSGGTAIPAGTVRLDGAASSLGSGTVTMADGTFLRLNRGDTTDSSSQFQTFANELVVASGVTATVYNTPRGAWSGPLTGSGTLNLRVNATRGDLTNPWAGFSGQINVTSRTGTSDFRIAMGGSTANPTGLQLGNAKLNLADSVYMWQSANPPTGTGTQTTHNIGELSGSTSAILAGNPISGRFANWSVGALNTNSTFAGVIQNAAGAARLTKVGTGTLTLTNVNTYTGSTTINGGNLALGATGSIDASTALNLGAAGTLNTSAKSSFAIPATQTVTYNVDGTGSGSCGRINATGGTLDITNANVVFNIVAPLDDAVYVLASYTSLTGGAFASVTAPAGYSINYVYNNGTQIALVSDTGTPYTTWAAGYLPADVSNPAGDYDKDGLTNQQEFAFGLNPTSGSSVNPILVKLNKTTGTFTYQRRSNTGLTYRILTSSNLVSWPEDTAATANQAAGSVDGNGNQSVVVTLSGAPLVATKFFVRVAAQ